MYNLKGYHAVFAPSYMYMVDFCTPDHYEFHDILNFSLEEFTVLVYAWLYIALYFFLIVLERGYL